MSDKIIENNQVTIMGEVVSAFTFSHEVFGEGFYMVDVSVKRLSNSEDRIPVMISERLIDVSQDYTGEFLMISGQFRSYNRHEEQSRIYRRRIGWCQDEPYFVRWLHMQASDLSKDTAWKGNCRSFACSQPSLWEIGLYPLYLLGKKCKVCIDISSGRACPDTWKNPEQGICKEVDGNGDGKASGL